LVEGWEMKTRTNICQSQVTYLHAGALCVDYSVDGSVCCVGLASGEVVFISSQTASRVYTLRIGASPVRILQESVLSSNKKQNHTP